MQSVLYLFLAIGAVLGILLIYNIACAIDLTIIKKKLKKSPRIKMSKFPNLLRILFGINRLMKRSGAESKAAKLKKKINLALVVDALIIYNLFIGTFMCVAGFSVGQLINNAEATTIYTSRNIILKRIQEKEEAEKKDEDEDRTDTWVEDADEEVPDTDTSTTTVTSTSDDVDDVEDEVIDDVTIDDEDTIIDEEV